MGEGGRVVHAIAHHRDNATLSDERTYALELGLGQQVRLHLTDPKAAGDGIGHVPRVAGQQHCPHAEAGKACERATRFGAYRIGDFDHAEQAIVACYEDPRGAVAAGRHGRRHGDAAVRHPRAVADEDRHAGHGGRDAAARHVVKAFGFREREPCV